MKGLLSASASACLLAVTISGCYWLASYQDLTIGLGDSGPVFDAPPVDQDGPRFDGGEPPDAPADGQAVEAAGPFCPPDGGPLVYCMDFDGVDAASLPGLGTNQASAEIVSTQSVSPPSSLHVSVYGIGSSGSYYVQLPIKPTTAQLQFDIFAAALGQWVTTLSITLYQKSTQTNQNLNAVVNPKGEFQVQEYFSLQDGGNEQNGHAAYGPDGGTTLGMWHHVVLSLTVDDAQQRYLSGLSVDGQVVEQDQPLGLTWSQGNANLGIGVTYSGGGGPEFYFDNVRADFGL